MLIYVERFPLSHLTRLYDLMVNDFATNLSSLKDFRQSFILDPARWKLFQAVPPLNWTPVKFEQSSLQNIPENRGIYMFVIQFQDHALVPTRLPMHGYIMYGGITGKEADTGTLKSRFENYLREQKRAKRMQIYSMLNKWKDNLYFYYSIVAPNIDLGALEIALNDSVIPPLVTNDFSAEVRKLVRVLRTT